MSNSLEFIMKLRDMVSTPLQAMHSTGVQTYKRLEAAAGAYQRKNDQIPQSIAQVKQRLNELQQTREISISRRQISAVNKEIAELEQRLRNLDRNADGGGIFSGGMGSMLRQGMAVAGVASIGMLAGSIFNMGMQEEMQKASFSTMLGGDKQAASMMGNIRKMAAATPFTTNDLIGSSQTLLQFGIDAQKVIPTMQMLGDVSGGNAERMKGLTLAFAQMSSTGKLQGQDLMQMVNAGFNPLLEISNKTGISMADLKEKMEKGAISSNLIELAFRSATSEGGRFYNMTYIQSQTTGGRFLSLMDEIQNKGLDIYHALQPMLNQLLDIGIWLMDNTEVIATFGAAIGAYALYTNSAAIATKLWTGAQWLLNAAMSTNIIGLVIGGIVALGGMIYWAYNKFDWFRGGVMGAWSAVKEFATLIKDFVIDRIKGLLTGISGIGSALIKLFKGDFSGAWDAAKQGISDLTGITAAKNAYNNSYKVVDAAKQGYKKGMADFAAEKAKTKANAPAGLGAAPTAADFTAALAAGDGSGKNSKKSGSVLSDSVDGITGNSGRNININLGKFFDNIIINTQTINEGIDNLQAHVEEAMMRITNSVNTAG